MHRTAIKTLFLLTILLTCAGIGWYAWSITHKHTKPSHNTQTAPTNNNQQPRSKAKDTKTAPSTTTNPTAQDENNYLVIKEWGLRLPLAEEIRGDVKYGAFISDKGEQIMYFTSNKVATKSGNGGCDISYTKASYGEGMFGGLYAINRAVTKPDDKPEDMQLHASDGYWYSWEPGGKFACYDGDTGEESGLFRVLLEKSFKNLEPIQP